jgi:flagellar basal body-associated protein FliL
MNEPGIADEIDDDGVAMEDDAMAVNGGYIALIVIGVVIFLLGVGLCIMVVLRKKNSGSAETVVQNVAYVTTANGTLGQFKCAECGKDYNYAEDLAEHTQLRHAIAQQQPNTTDP